MTEKQFGKLVSEIQTFMGLDNWHLDYRITELEEGVNGQIDKTLYQYFNVAISFDPSVLKLEYDEYIEHVIFHELSHIYTTATLDQYDYEREFIAHHIGEVAFVELKNKFVYTNEQQTELLARRFHNMYKNLHKSK